MAIELDNGLVGYWPFNEGKGSEFTVDKSSNSNTGILSNMDDSNWKSGVSGRCLSFNGIDESVDCGNNSSLDILGSFSISAWILMNSSAVGVQYIFMKNKNSVADAQYIFVCDGTNKRIRGGFNGAFYGETDNDSIDHGKWFHVVMVYDQIDIKYYINNVLSNTPHVISDTIISTNHNVVVGKRFPNNYFMDGFIDELRLYNRALKPNEISFLYNNPSGKIETDINRDMVGYWSFDEGTGTYKTRDDSGCGNDGEFQYMNEHRWKNGISGKCVEFDGVEEWIDCGDDDTLKLNQSGWSVSVWIYITDGNTLNTIYITGAYEWIVCVVGQNVYLARFDLSDLVLGSGLINNKWNHIVVTSYGDEKKIYINKVNVVTDSKTYPDAVYGRIAYSYTTAYYYKGLIDELRIYSRRLNQNEINFLFNYPSGTQKDRVSARLLITDHEGKHHSVTENIESLTLNNALGYSSDTFELVLTNFNDAYSYIEFGCEIEILMGIGGVNTKHLTGIITEAVYTLDDELVVPRIEVTGEDMLYRLHDVYIFNVLSDKEISAGLIEILDTIDITTGQTTRQLAGIDATNEGIYQTTHTPKITTFAWTSLAEAIKEYAAYAGFEWKIDVNKILHFFEPRELVVSMIITDNDLISNPRISINKKAVNRAMVFGGYADKVDQIGIPYTNIFRVTDVDSFESVFIPTHNLLSSVSIYTMYVSDSNLILTIRDKLGNIISNSLTTVYTEDVVIYGYSLFKFMTYVNLTEGEEYTIHLEATTSTGVIVGYGKNVLDENVLDFVTRYPVRIAHVVNDMDSYEKHGLYTNIHVDKHIEDPTIAALKCMSMINPEPKKTAILSIKNTNVRTGELVMVNITKPGIKLNKEMKVFNSTLILKECYIENELELEEL